MADDTTDYVLVYTSLTQAEEAGCHIGDCEEKITPECKIELEELQNQDRVEILLLSL
jgi:hypothetical protein